MSFRRVAAMVMAILITTGSLQTGSIKPVVAVEASVSADDITAAVSESAVKATADSGTCGSDATYKFEDGVLTISGTGTISSYAFERSSDIKSVVIEEGITEIGDEAFYYCENLSSISLPSTLTAIGYDAFYNCTSLTNVTIPESVVEIKSYAFDGCTSLETITIKSAETDISEASLAFSDAVIIAPTGSLAEAFARKYYKTFRDIETGEESLYGQLSETITYSIDEVGVMTVSGTGEIPDDATVMGISSCSALVVEEGITSIGDGVFQSSGFESVSLPSTLETIGDSAFESCDYLTSVTMPDSVTSLGDYAFAYCYGLTEVKLSAGLTSVGESAFINCGDLTGIDIPDGVTSIGPTAFCGCTSLTYATIPESVANLARGAFYRCYILRKITIPNKECVFDDDFTDVPIPIEGYMDSTAYEYCFEHGVEFIDIETGDSCIRGKCGDDLTYEISDGVLTITGSGEMHDDPSFSRKSNFTSVVFDGEITSISEGAFFDCDLIEEVTVPETVTSIGDDAFKSCDQLSKVTILNKDCEITDSSYTIPSRVYIEGYAGSTAQVYARTYGNTFIDIETGEATTGGDLSENASFEIKDGQVIISGKGDLPDYSYDTSPFYGRNDITSVVIEKGITGGGAYLFYNCDNIEEVTLPAGLVSIGAYEFRNTGITSIELPSTVTSIGDYAFYNCTSLETVKFSEKLTTIGNYVFSQCSALTEITLPTSLKEIGSGAFSYCYNMKLAGLPEGLETIGESAFYSCIMPDELTIPESVKSIGASAFYSYSSGNLKKFIITSKDVEILGTNSTFYGAEIFAYSGSTAQDYAKKYGLFFNDLETGERYLVGSYDVYSYKIEDGVLTLSGSGPCEDIPRSTLPGSQEVEKVIIEDGVETIGSSAFSSFSKLTEVQIPDSVTYIGSSAFAYCYALDEVLIPNAECEFPSTSSIVSSGTTIAGHTDSTAQAHAYQNGCKFHDIDKDTYIQQGKCGDDMTFTIADGVITITGTGEMYSDPSFSGNTDITSAVIEKGVESIGDYAFSNCTSLTSVTIPSTVTSIGESAFYYCTSLKNVKLPKGLKTIGTSSFESCYALNSITLPSTLETIGAEAFYGCSSLKGITFPDSLTSIGNSAFSSTGLTGVIAIPASVKEIGTSAFSYSYSLTGVDIMDPECVLPSSGDILYSTSAYIGGYAGSTAQEMALKNGRKFHNVETNEITIGGYCGDNMSYTVVGSTMTISGTGEMRPDSIYISNDPVKEIVVEDGVTDLNANALSNFSNVTSITLPATAAITDPGALSIMKLVTMDIDEANENYVFENSCLFNKDKTQLLMVSGIAKQVDIPDTVTKICAGALSHCPNLTNVVLPESVNEVESNALYGVSGDCKITFMDPKCVISDSESTINNNATIVGYDQSTAKEYAYNYGRRFMDIDTGAVTQSGKCGEEASYSVEDDALIISGTGPMSDGSTFNGKNNIKKIIIESGITSISASAFQGFDNVTSVQIADTVESIGERAFYDCDSLISITIPDSVKEMGSSVFYGCEALYSVQLPEGLESIPDQTFSSCSKLGRVNIPDTVTSIGADAFYYCYSLESIEIPESVTSIGEEAFYYCNKLNKIDLPKGMTTISRYAFYGCYGITSIEIPDGVTSIDYSAFSSCSGLTEINIPASVKSIGSSAFSDCSKIKEITIADPECEIYSSSYTFPSQASIVGSAGSTAQTYAESFGRKFIDIETGEVTQKGKCGDDLTYTIVDGVVTISGTGAMSSPSPFENHDQITGVIIEEGVTSISSNGFYDCDSIKSVSLPSTLESIGSQAFAYCDVLRELVIPETKKTLTIEYEALYSYADSNKITFLNKDCVFNSDDIINSSTAIVGYLGSTADQYAEDNSRKFIDIETGKTIMRGSFGSGSKYIVEDGVMTISGTGELTGNYNVETSLVTDVVIEEGITGIGDSAFSSYSSLKSIKIPSTVENINSTAFTDSVQLKDVEISADNKALVYEDGMILDADKTKLLLVMPYVKKLQIPATVTTIGTFAFTGADLVEEVTLPKTVTDVEVGAFGGCSGLTKLTVLNKKCNIDPSGVTVCQNYNYEYHDSEMVYTSTRYSGIIAGYVGSTTEEFAFNNGLKFLDLDTGEIIQKGQCGDDMTYSIKNGILSITGSGEMYDDPSFRSNSEVTDIFIEEGVTAIGENAFKYFSKLRTVALPSTLKDIGDYAFYQCYNLDSVTLPSGLENIGSYAFYNCKGLSSISIPGTVKTIDDRAFYYCDIRRLTLEDGIETIGNYAFAENTIKTIDIPASVQVIGEGAFGEPYNSIGSGVVTIFNPECDILFSSNTFDTAYTIYSYAGSTAEKYAFEYGRKFGDVETGKAKQEGKCGNDLLFSIQGNVLNITGTGDMWDQPLFRGNSSIVEVNIADGVTSIGKNAFDDLHMITMNIPASVKKIDASAFGYSNQLSSFTVDKNNENFTVQNGVLMSKDKTKVVCYPCNKGGTEYKLDESITAIEPDAFLNNNLKMLTILNKDCSINGNIDSDVIIAGYKGSTAETFAYDNRRYFHDLDTGLTTLKGRCGVDLTYELSADGHLVISGTGEIDDNAFSNNDNIKTVTIEEGVTSIGSYAFYDCDGIDEIELPSTVETIKYEAFYNSSLSSIKLNEGLKTIDGWAFENTYLKKVDLPSTLTSLANNVFYGTSLEEINVAENSKTFASVDGVLYDKALETIIIYPKYKKDKILTLPETVKSIGSSSDLFSNNYNLTEIVITDPECEIYDAAETINNAIVISAAKDSNAAQYAYNYGKKFREIGSDVIQQQGPCGPDLEYSISEDGTLTITGTGEMYASPQFRGNDNIKKAIIESGATSIGDQAFYDCNNLASVTIPDTVVTIGEGAFDYCSSLKEIDIPAAVKSIGDKTFIDCDNLTSINVDAKNAAYSSADGVLYNKDGSELILYPRRKTGKEFTIPSSVKVIGDYAFNYCSNLNSVTIPEGVERIGYYAFEECRITSISIPKTVEFIGNSAFRYCRDLSDVSIANGVTRIGDSTFEGCYTLKEIDLPESVSVIDNQAFYDCSSLKTVTIRNKDCQIYPENSTIYYKAIVCGYEESTAYDFAYRNGRKFQVIDTDEIIQRGKCGAFLTFDIKDGVLTISGFGEMYDSPSFRENSEITSVVIEEGATYIGGYAFYSCSGLESVTLPSTLTGMGEYAFSNCNKLTSITIPEGVAEISRYAFNSCYSLTDVKLPSTIRSIHQWAFASCRDLETIDLPEGLLEIGSGAFSSDYALKSIKLPETIQTIDSSAFNNCNISSVTIPASVNYLAGDAFSSNSSLEEITVDSKNETYKSVDGVVYSISGDILVSYPCGKKGTAFVIPETVKTIGRNAISYSDQLKELTIPDTVESIEEYGVYGSFDKVTVLSTDCQIYPSSYAISAKLICGYENSTVERYAGQYGKWFKSLDTDRTYRKGHNGNAEYIIEDGVCTLSGSGSIYVDDSTIEKVVVGPEITSFDVSSSGSKIKEYVVDPDNQKYTSKDGVLYNKDMTSIIKYPTGKTDKTFTIPDTVKSAQYIENKYLEELTLGKDTLFGSTYITHDEEGNETGESITYYFNSNLESLTKISVPADNPYHSSVDGVLFSKDKKTLVRYPHAKADKSYTVPDTVERILYLENKNLESLTLGKNVDFSYKSGYINDEGESVETLYYMADIYCPELKQVAVSKDNAGLISENNAVYDKDKTTLILYAANAPAESFSIPDTVKEVNSNNTFNNLKELHVGANVESLPGYYYYDYYYYGKPFPALEKVTLSDKNKTLFVKDDILYRNVVDENGEYIAVVLVPSNISGDVTIVDGVRYIPSRCFSENSELTGVTLPESVQGIGYLAFAECSALKNVTIMNPDCGTDGSSISNRVENVYAEDGETIVGSDPIYNGTITGKKDSRVEEWANDFGYTFVDIDSDQPKPPVTTTTPSTTTTTTTTTTTKPATTTSTTTTKPVTTTSTVTTKPAVTSTTTKPATTTSTVTTKPAVTSTTTKPVTTTSTVTTKPAVTSTTTKPVTTTSTVTTKPVVTSTTTKPVTTTSTVTTKPAVTSTTTKPVTTTSTVTTKPAVTSTTTKPVATTTKPAVSTTKPVTTTIPGGTTTVQTTVVTTTSAPVTTAEPSTAVTWETAKLGDVNLDDVVDSTDASDILGLYAALNTGSKAEDFDPGFMAASDVDNDGMIDATDASFVLQYYSYTQTGGTGTMEEYMKNENGK